MIPLFALTLANIDSYIVNYSKSYLILICCPSCKDLLGFSMTLSPNFNPFLAMSLFLIFTILTLRFYT